MRRYKFLILAIFLFLLCPFKTTADDLTKFKNLASNVTYDYTYEEKDGKVIFTIRFVNVNKELMIIDETHDKSYWETDDGIINISGFEENKTYEFSVYGVTYGESVKFQQKKVHQIIPDTELTIYVTLPKYNQYYTDEVCVGNEEYELCNKWANHSLDHEEFVKQVQKYASLKEKKESIDSETQHFDYRYFLAEYSVLILTAISIVILIIIYLIQNSREKKNSFEGW